MPEADPGTAPRRAEVQDNARQRQILDLLRLQGEASRNGDDAYDELGNHYELKSSTQKDVGTGRDLGEAYLAAMERRYLICAFGVNTQYGFTISDLFLVHPAQLRGWIAQRRKRLENSTALVERVLAAAGSEVTAEDSEALRRLVRRGATENNPKIPGKLIKSTGFKLEDAAHLQLRTLVRQHPIN